MYVQLVATLKHVTNHYSGNYKRRWFRRVNVSVPFNRWPH